MGTKFLGKLSFSDKEIAIKIYPDPGLAQLGFEQLGPRSLAWRKDEWFL